MVDHPHVIVELIPSRAIQKNPMFRDSFRAVPMSTLIMNPDFPANKNKLKESQVAETEQSDTK